MSFRSFAVVLRSVDLLFLFFFTLLQPDEDLFNPDYVEVDRVLEVAVTTDTETGEVGDATKKHAHMRAHMLHLFVCLGSDALPGEVVQLVL